MLNFPKETKHEPKCYVTHGTIGHVDTKQTPTRRKPFVNILGYKYINKVEMILPQEMYEVMRREMEEVFAEDGGPLYSRVVMPLSALIEGEFFTEYIKKGNVLMLSKGRIGVDNVFSLCEGILTLHLDKEIYERSGLVGRPEGVKGKREHRPRWIVEINLRLPSMLHGKKGFQRIEYAFKNVLTTPVMWLFCNLGTTGEDLYTPLAARLTPSPVLPSDPLSPHHSHKITCAPRVLSGIQVKRPDLKLATENNSSYDEDFREYSVGIHEWLSLISLESPRVNSTDSIDTFLSRYDPPIGSDETEELVKVTWTGFISPAWAHSTFIQALLTAPKDSWLSYYVGGFSESWNGGSKNSTILKLPAIPNDYILWEVE